MNILMVNNLEIEMSETNTTDLNDLGTIYHCETCQAYHLTPDHNFTLQEVECLINVSEDYPSWK